MNTTLENIQKAMEGMGQYLGDEIFWSVSEVEISYGEMEALFDKYGLDKLLMPPEPNKEKAFRRAVSKMKRVRTTKAVSGNDELVRLISEDDEKILYAVVRENKVQSNPAGSAVAMATESDETLDHTIADRVAYLKASEEIVSDNNSAVASAIRELWSRYSQTLTTDDVHLVLRDAMRRFRAIAIREHGGVYFVPAHYAGQIEALRQVVGRIGQSSVGVLNLYGTEASKEALGKAAESDLASQINKLVEEVDKFNNKVRTGTLERRIEEFKSLKGQVEMYSEILTFAKDELLSRIATAQSKVSELLLGEV